MSSIVNKVKDALSSDKQQSSTATSDPEGTHGPHDSRAANAADPRIDSDRDDRPSHGAGGTLSSRYAADGSNTQPTEPGYASTTGSTAAGHGTAGTTSGAYSSGEPEGTHGPHSSRAGNAADPRVDSDRDHRAAAGNTAGATGAYGSTGHTATHGLHSATGPAPNTAGPHKSDMLNKADPRVDSNLDGSKTHGGNKTFQADTSNAASRDPTDASQAPPSVLRKHVGEPSIEHEDHTHDRARRHSVVSAQEAHRGY